MQVEERVHVLLYEFSAHSLPPQLKAQVTKICVCVTDEDILHATFSRWARLVFRRHGHARRSQVAAMRNSTLTAINA